MFVFVLLLILGMYSEIIRGRKSADINAFCRHLCGRCKIEKTADIIDPHAETSCKRPKACTCDLFVDIVNS